MKHRNLWLITISVLLLAGVGSWLIRSSRGGGVGVVDSGQIEREYILPALQPALEKQREALQQELDNELEGLDEEAKQEVYSTYQNRFLEKEKELWDELLPKVRDAIGRVARQRGVQVVLSGEPVVWGGVDLTNQVLKELKK